MITIAYPWLYSTKFLFAWEYVLFRKYKVFISINTQIQIKTKKEYFGGPLVDFQIDVDLLSDIALKLDPTQYNDLQKAIYGTLSCLSRQPKQPTAADTAPKTEENGHASVNNNTNNIRDDISET